MIFESPGAFAHNFVNSLMTNLIVLESIRLESESPGSLASIAIQKKLKYDHEKSQVM